jgi:dihydrolipoamide dehydrogenase
MNAHTTTLLVIGGGPGGYVAAIRAGQLGIPTTLIESAQLGGTCLNVGCIPSKALIHAADEFEKTCHFADGSALGISVQSSKIDLAQTTRWKDGIVSRMTGGVAGLLKKNGVHVIKGHANIIDGKTVEIVREGEAPARIGCQHLLVATGSYTTELPFMPFSGRVISATEALSPSAVPKRMVVIGAGYIGLELGIAYRKLGTQVTVVEAQDSVLPAYDADLTKAVANSIKGLGIELHLSSSVLGLTTKSESIRVRGPQGNEFELEADQFLVAVGRRPRTKGFGLESLMLDMAGHFIKVDDQCRTSMRDVWAIGDVTGEPMLAHRAMAQGEMVAEIIAGKKRHFNPTAIPAVCFTDPELVVVGLTPQEAKKAGMDCIDALFPFSANGRAMTLESKDGFVRVVARRDNHLIVGWQAVGKSVSELSAAFSQSLEMGARLEDIAGTIHAHPTLGEAIQEAALRALGHALHI